MGARAIFSPHRQDEICRDGGVVLACLKLCGSEHCAKSELLPPAESPATPGHF
jgi:hypothetical protein